MTKRILSALLAALLILCALTPALAEETAEAPDLAALYPAAPITLADYTELYTQMMTEYVDPEYARNTAWHLVSLPDGSIVLTDGIHFEGIFVISLTVEGPYVKSIRVSWPYDGTNAQEAFNFYSSWCVIAAAPLAMRDGTPFTDAVSIIAADLERVMHARSALETHTVCGMEARMGRTTGEYGTVTMTYTFHREPEALPRPSGDDLTAVSAQAYMQALDAYYLGLMGEPFVWTNPEDWLGGTLVAGDCLGDIPALMIIEDKLAMLMVSMPRYPDDIQGDCDTMHVFARLCCLPLLTASGMTTEQAEAAWALWVEESHFPALLSSALTGTPCTTWFYGFPVQVDADGERISFTMFTSLAGQLIIPEGEMTE